MKNEQKKKVRLYWNTKDDYKTSIVIRKNIATKNMNI